MPIIPIIIIILLASIWLIFAIAHHRSDDLDISRPRKKMVYDPDTGAFTTETVKKPMFPKTTTKPTTYSTPKTRSATKSTASGDKTVPTVGGMLKNIYLIHIVVITIAGLLTDAIGADFILGFAIMVLWVGTLVYILVCLVRCPQGTARKPYAVWFGLVVAMVPYAIIVILPCALVATMVALSFD